jgi:hypothetical protein
MTDNQIKKGIWYWDRENNWPPDSTTYLDKYNPSSKLNLNITQLTIGTTEQKKLVKAWCSELPKLSEIKYLWFCSRVSQEMFEAACEIENLEGLYIKWSGIKHIDSLIKLKNLRHLHIGSSGQIESISVFEKMNWLMTLNLEQLNKISDFSVISNLTNLKGLGIDGSMWTAQKIDTLKPIGHLIGLKYLTLTNSRIKDKSFDPILNLNELVRFNSSWNYPENEFKKLKSLPNLKYGNVETSLKEIMEKIKTK